MNNDTTVYSVYLIDYFWKPFLTEPYPMDTFLKTSEKVLTEIDSHSIPGRFLSIPGGFLVDSWSIPGRFPVDSR